MVYVFLADGFEEIEALTVVDVLRRAEIPVKTVSVNKEMVKGAHDISVQADCLIDDVVFEEAEMFVLPGGMPGTKNLEENEKVQMLLKSAVEQGKWVAAICAAPMILGNQGYLKNMKATCFPGFEEYLKEADVSDNPLEICGKFITSKGPGTAMDFAFAIVSVLKDENTAQNLREQMQAIKSR